MTQASDPPRGPLEPGGQPDSAGWPVPTRLSGTTQLLPGGEAGTAPRASPEPEPEPETRPSHAGDRLGPWLLDAKIGEGGMGEVWLARRADGLYQADAAIKLLRSDLPRARLAARFARERRVLARLNHPGIAKLLDAGITDDHQAWLVLEYVQGWTLNTHVRRRCPTVAQRVALLIEVAEAVAHAHAQLIVHRDLKPNNVLVTPEGAPKLLDFGIAALLDDDDEQSSQLTRMTGRGHTLGYAPPEQITGGAVGVAGDVFSLGVMLHELLSGELPFSHVDAPRTELEHAVLHEPPRRASHSRAQPPERPTDARLVRGDLDAIVAKALRKKPEERYESVRALIDDLQRWREHLPVRARRDDWRHRARLWLKRNALIAGLSLATVVALGSGLALSLQQWRRAEAAAQLSDQVTGYLTELLASAGPEAHGGQWPNVLQLLEKSRTDIDTQFAAAPDTRLRLLDVLVDTYIALNRYDQALPLAEQALALARQHHGALGRPTLRAQLMLARVYAPLGPWDKVVNLLEPIREPVIAEFGLNTQPTRQLLYALNAAYVKMGRLAEAEATLLQAGRVTAAIYGNDSHEAAEHHNHLSVLYSELGRTRESLGELRKTATFQRSTAADDRRLALVLQRNTLAMQQRLGEIDDNEARAARLFTQIDQLLGPRSGLRLSLHNEMARWHTDRGEYAKALIHRDAVLDSGGPDATAARTGQLPARAARLLTRALAGAAPAAALGAEATQLAAQAEQQHETLGALAVDTWLALGRAGLLLGQPALAEQAVRRLRGATTLNLRDGESRGSRLNQLEGELLRQRGDLPGSAALLAKRVQWLARDADQALPATWHARLSLAATLVQQGSPAAAQALEQARAARPAGWPPGHPMDAVAGLLHARLAGGGAATATGAESASAAAAAAAAAAKVDAAFGWAVPWPVVGVFQ
ncbi:serine/threonine-protein kinase [Aquabacterium sp. OR-4]|uniref:serine/threonine-protein kinase n=1 Tax=Aquabacterium sp. OR-4 TaxID=2978127 RepID=UPI0028C8D874|nr:serine/threonine-protein kinase [Aquabacterium sp. OR-4]MDT7838163.1 serine/threonine-protein kinase [Aquabacterium sp. OR-4]